ncbi:TlyA family RNA methyltransferase [Ornithinimicrobium sp. Arc0846-15]|nr:TlyA family RNA methyltransferase [Ornithinimicrobium laminariae]
MNAETPAADRLDRMVTSLGLARSRTQARELILTGAVSVGGQVVTKPSAVVSAQDVAVEATAEQRWVGRGAQKLAGALEHWTTELRVSGRKALDVGASTGGFTQVLLDAGATHVIALDVGHDQLVAELANDARVTDMSGKNIRSTTVAEIDGAVSLLVADLSFIPLSIVIPAMASLVTSDADLVLLAKPQFEVGPDRVGRNGIVRSHEARRDALLAVTRSIYTSGLAIKDIMPSVITGGGGNREYVVWAKPEQPGLWDEDIARQNVQEIIRREHE